MQQRTTPCLWFDRQAEDAARFYGSVFPNSRIKAITHYGEGMPMPAGTVLTVAFELDGQDWLALNGGPQFQFNHAVSFVVNCTTQAEIDHYWERLADGGAVEQCGWLRDRYGVSWQVVPTQLAAWMSDPACSPRVLQAILGMVKLDLAALQRAHEGS